MKFLANHCQVRDDLVNWAGTRTLLVAQYYFWAAEGTSLQNSLEGLLRSLLFQTLRCFPQLIDATFPEQDWLLGGPRFRFSKESMLKGLKRIISKGNDEGLRACYFIDGLDEFDGRDEFAEDIWNAYELLELLRIFYNSPFAKLCVSSRPWNEFRKEFQLKPERQLVMHELTRRDIKKFILDSFMDNPTFKRLSGQDDSYMQLVHGILDAAQGIFLWVRIVSKTLLSGIDNEDRIITLQKKLRQLPLSLEKLYGHLLDKVSPHYRGGAARLFFALSRIPHIRLTPILAAFVYLDPSEQVDLIDQECNSMDDLMDIWTARETAVGAYCKGLVDFGGPNLQHPAIYDSVVHKNLQVIADSTYRLRYVHRTVGEYLRKPETQSRLVNNAFANEDIVRASVCRGQLDLLGALIAGWKKIGVEKNHFPSAVYSLIGNIIRGIESVKSDDELYKLWTRLNSVLHRSVTETGVTVLQYFTAYSRDRIDDSKRSSGDLALDTVGLAIHFNVATEALARLSHVYPDLLKYTKGSISPLMILFLSADNLTQYERRVRTLDFEESFEILVRHGADPNQKWANTTPWISCLSRAFWRVCFLHDFRPQDLPNRSRRKTLPIEVFFRHKVDLDAMCNFSLVYQKVWRRVGMWPQWDYQGYHSLWSPRSYLKEENCAIMTSASFSARSIIGCLRRRGMSFDWSSICEDYGNSPHPEDVVQSIEKEIMHQAVILGLHTVATPSLNERCLVAMC
jgi:hypothetical protein